MCLSAGILGVGPIGEGDGGGDLGGDRGSLRVWGFEAKEMR